MNAAFPSMAFEKACRIAGRTVRSEFGVPKDEDEENKGILAFIEALNGVHVEEEVEEKPAAKEAPEPGRRWKVPVRKNPTSSGSAGEEAKKPAPKPVQAALPAAVEVSAEETVRRLSRGERLYAVTYPQDGVGLWIGTWTYLKRRYGHQVQGEREWRLDDAYKHFAGGRTDLERPSIREAR